MTLLDPTTYSRSKYSRSNLSASPSPNPGLLPSVARQRGSCPESSAALTGLSAEDQRLFVEFGFGPEAAPHHDLLHEAVTAQALARPTAVALEYVGETVSYEQLERRSNQIASGLRKRGVGRGDMVGLFAERCPALIAGMLGVLKTGAAYVPQHAGVAPAAQLAHIVEVTEMTTVLTLDHLRQHLPTFDGDPSVGPLVEIFDLDSFSSDAAGESVAGADVSPDDTCFVLFTSGTTGPPNGVAVTHRNVANIVFTSPGDLGIEPGLRVGQLLSIAFDMAEWEIYGALGHGATLAIRGKDIQATAEAVDVIISTPSILASLDADRCAANVTTVAVAGEPCPRSLADTWSQFASFHNSCGPTETTIVNTVKHYVGAGDSLTIGKPTPNNTVYVLDEDLKPLPIGEVGEMWAGGECVTSGYLANPALNAERYRVDPFVGGGRRMFRTRDLGRWNENGELEHYGRTDDQVKIRGFRVELDSVSSVLESLPGCDRAVTLKYDDRNLIAFVEPAEVDVEQAAAAVAAALPYYCVPATIVALERLPRTDRGKIDKKTLTIDHLEGAE